MSDSYIINHFDDIKRYASVIEARGEDDYCTLDNILKDNADMLEQCRKYGANYILIDDEYQVDIEL